MSQTSFELGDVAEEHTFSVGELNPTRSRGVPTAIPRFVEVLAETLATTRA